MVQEVAASLDFDAMEHNDVDPQTPSFPTPTGGPTSSPIDTSSPTTIVPSPISTAESGAPLPTSTAASPTPTAESGAKTTTLSPAEPQPSPRPAPHHSTRVTQPPLRL
ncbi:unnamed protein product [Linum trigynum]|uniref:Uncharacterized protein n=1 Tax=Linum trigynum TaxID=586398 RepID=A0AAV2FAG7_9ROSI